MMELTPGDLLTLTSMGGGKGGGTSDYASLRHKPTINGVTVTGDLSGADLSLATLDSSGRVPAEQLPSATAAPLMDGTADAGSAEAFAREDHVHPTDTSRASTAVAVSGGANGLMTGADKAKLDNINLPAGGVSLPETLPNQTVASFQSSTAGRPLRVTASIQPVQAAGTPSPENPLPITGWTGANIYVSPTTTAADGTSYAFTFPSSAGIICGGTLDLRTGLLTVTHILWERNTSTMDNSETYPGWSSSGLIPWIGDVRNAVVSTMTNLGSQATLMANGSIAFFRLPTKTQSEWKSLALDYQAVIALAAPLTYQLTPQQLVTLDGTNNVFADCGPVTVKHWPGTGIPVEPVEDGTEIKWKTGVLERIAALEARS